MNACENRSQSKTANAAFFSCGFEPSSANGSQNANTVVYPGTALSVSVFVFSLSALRLSARFFGFLRITVSAMIDRVEKRIKGQQEI